jgi:hypothetical protein
VRVGVKFGAWIGTDPWPFRAEQAHAQMPCFQLVPALWSHGTCSVLGSSLASLVSSARFGAIIVCTMDADICVIKCSDVVVVNRISQRHGSL